MSWTQQLGTVLLRMVFGLALLALSVSGVWSADVYMRVKVIDPPGETFQVNSRAIIHNDPWYTGNDNQDAKGGEWTPWIDLTQWKLHGRMNRVGGVAEWPAGRVSISRPGNNTPINGCQLQVQLADKPDPASVVIDFTEKSGSAAISFLIPNPLREHKDEFERGSDITARELRWAQEASGGQAPNLKKFDILTSVWGHYDPVLADQATQTLKLLGINVMGGVPVSVLQKYGMRTYTATWHMLPDPEESAAQWAKGDGAGIINAMKTADGKWTNEHMAHYVVCDEIQTLGFGGVKPEKLNGWFQAYLRGKGETDASMGKAIDTIEYPVKEVRAKTFPRDADLTTRKIMYYAGKFGQWWSVKSLRQTTDLVKGSFKSVNLPIKTETLPSDHHFFNAWGPPACGMDATCLDFFEIGNQAAVDIISTEDWLGLNHMYGPGYTWTGAWAFEYLGAIFRGGIGDRTDVVLRGLITPSDNNYLRLKAYSIIGQGAKSLFYWTFGPTYLGTENYFSDQRSEYDGIAKVSKALAKSEDVLYPAKPVCDPVAVLYSVSHDLWHTDDPASFVENRLTWTAIRQLGIQPDMIREEDVEAGKLAKYKVLYITGQCLTRKAAAQIDVWVRKGGVVYLAGGAATRDEFYTPFVPAFAKTVWPADAATQLIAEQGHSYNERGDLPGIKPLTTAKVTAGGKTFDMKVIGDRLNLKDGLPAKALLATFADGKPAGATVAYGKGRIVAVGFLPGLGYSPFKQGQTTLDEVWQPEPRELFRLPLALGLKGKQTVALSVPVVEGSLLTGPQGSALVLVNYTYQPVKTLKVTVAPSCKFTTATSTEGVPVQMKKTAAGTELTLPLEWTDIVVLK